MTLQASGAITLANIQAEFGGPTSPILLSNYYRGGSYVPDTSVNASIPASGPIYLTNFYGSAAVQFPTTWYDQTPYGAAVVPGSASTYVTFSRNGSVAIFGSTSGTGGFAWIDPTGSTVGDAYQIYIASSGALSSSPALDTWHALSSDRTVTLNLSDEGVVERTLNIQIRVAATGVVVSTGTITLTVEVDAGGGE